jgi:hypothetical protein
MISDIKDIEIEGGLKSEVQRTEERGQDDKQDKLSAVE